MEDFKVLTTNDLMDIFGISRNKAVRIMNMPGFPSLKIGRTYVITYANFEKWMKDNEKKQVLL